MAFRYMRLPTLSESISNGNTVVNINALIEAMMGRVAPLSIFMIAVMLQPLIRLWKLNKRIRITGTCAQSKRFYVSEYIPPSPQHGRTVETLLSVQMQRMPTQAGASDPVPLMLQLRQIVGGAQWPGLTSTQVISGFAYYNKHYGDHLVSVYRASTHLPINVTAEDGADELLQADPLLIDRSNNQAEVREQRES